MTYWHTLPTGGVSPKELPLGFTRCLGRILRLRTGRAQANCTWTGQPVHPMGCIPGVLRFTHHTDDATSHGSRSRKWRGRGLNPCRRAESLTFCHSTSEFPGEVTRGGGSQLSLNSTSVKAFRRVRLAVCLTVVHRLFLSVLLVSASSTSRSGGFSSRLSGVSLIVS